MERSIVAEYVSWGNKTIEANGVGAYIAEATAAGDQPRILLGLSCSRVLCSF